MYRLSPPGQVGRILGLVLLFGLLLAAVQYWRTEPGARWSLTTSTAAKAGHPPAAPATDLPNDDVFCAAFPDPGTIAIAVKTGATEAPGKIPMQMLTTLRCAQSVKIYSDLEQTISGYQLHDALEDISTSVMQGNTDFDFYFKLKEAKRYGQIENMLKNYMDPRITNDLAAWTLDKYKDLHILEQLYEAYPDKDYYLMMDADTYLVWSNLLTWLQQLPNGKSKKLYLGAPAVVGPVQFAHGGSGVFLSHAAMYDFAVTHGGAAARWDERIHEECCGDYVVGVELKKNDIILSPSWPTVNGEKPITLPFGPTHWCQPMVTMHHVLPNEMNQLWNMEISRDHNKPLTFAELYHAFTEDVIPESMDQWNNLCLDRTMEVESWKACQSACEEDSQCFQFAFNGKTCTLGHSIHLGRYTATEAGVKWRSGWLKGRITEWVNSQKPCGEAKFPWT